MPRGRSRAKGSTRASSPEAKAGGDFGVGRPRRNESISLKKLLAFLDPTGSNCMRLSCVLIDQMVPFDRDAREGESAKSRAALRPMMPGLAPTTCRHLLAVPALRQGAFADWLAVRECRRKRNGTHAGAVWRPSLGKRGAFLLDRLISAGQNGVLAPRLAAAGRARSVLVGSCIIHA
jgi:hypothetical protein